MTPAATSPDVPAVLTVRGLTRSFKGKLALPPIDLAVAPGERVALFGPNGSGKTTLLRCVAGTLTPSAGQAWVGPHPGRQLGGAANGWAPRCTTERSFYLRLTGRANLLFFARLRHAGERAAVQNVENVVEELEIEDIVRQRLDGCSTGMLQQVALARALLGAPRLLLLDEPTKSLECRRRAAVSGARSSAASTPAPWWGPPTAPRTSPTAGGALALALSKTRPRAIYALVRRDFAITQSYRVAFYLDIVLGVVDLCIYFFISETFPHGDGGPRRSPQLLRFRCRRAGGDDRDRGHEHAARPARSRRAAHRDAGTLTVQPLSATELSLGMAGLPFLFAMVRVAVYLIVAGTLLGVSFAGADWVGFGVVLAASAAALSGIGVALGGLVLVIKRGAVLASLFTFALGLLGGAFFPVSVLPCWLQVVGEVVPTKFAFDGLRAALYQGGAGKTTL